MANLWLWLYNDTRISTIFKRVICSCKLGFIFLCKCTTILKRHPASHKGPFTIRFHLYETSRTGETIETHIDTKVANIWKSWKSKYPFTQLLYYQLGPQRDSSHECTRRQVQGCLLQHSLVIQKTGRNKTKHPLIWERTKTVKSYDGNHKARHFMEFLSKGIEESQEQCRVKSKFLNIKYNIIALM